MKKLLAIFMALFMVFALVGCAAEGDEPSITQPNGTEASPATEPEVTEEPPIEISEFCPEEDMPAPFEGDGAFADIFIGDYTPEWLYYHNIYDWRAAGITYNEVDSATGELLSMPLADDALVALKQKISDFTMIMMLDVPADIYASAPAITVDDDVYDITWLSSHNATEYTEAGIPAETVKQYLDALSENFWYTYEYRWVEEVYSRLTK